MKRYFITSDIHGFYNEFHKDLDMPDGDRTSEEGPEEMFRFIKVMK